MKNSASFQGREAGRCSRALVFAGLLGALVLAACTMGKPKLTLLATDAVVLAFGDSITYGTGASPEESYPAVLERITGKKVINAGVPGEVTAEGLARLPGVLDRYHPALMVLCLGGNDFLHRLDERQVADNLREMVRMARGRGVDVVLLGVPKLGFDPSPPPLYRQIAREFDIPCEANALKRILTKKSLKADFIHPNAQGYRIFAEAIADLLRKHGAL